MSQGFKLSSSNFIPFDAIRPHLPPELQAIAQEVWLERSRAVPPRFVPYMKINGQRGIAYFRKSDVIGWARATFGATHPESVAAMVTAFGEPSQTRPKKKVRRHVRS